MPDEDYERCRFSVACKTEDAAVLHCLRALAQFAEGSNIPKSIPWGGTKEAEWRRADFVATFRFTAPDYRQRFVEEVERLLPSGSCEIVGQSDNDPAQRRR